MAMSKQSEHDKRAVYMAQVKEYKKVIDIIEKIATRETQNPEGMSVFLNDILRLMCHPDLIDPNRFMKNSSKGKREAWDVDICNMLVKTMPIGAQEMYSQIVKTLTREERENRNTNHTSHLRRVDHEVMCAIARDALRSVMENELEVVEVYMNENDRRQKNTRRILTECRRKRILCRCRKRCIESYFGKCVKEEFQCSTCSDTVTPDYTAAAEAAALAKFFGVVDVGNKHDINKPTNFEKGGNGPRGPAPGNRDNAGNSSTKVPDDDNNDEDSIIGIILGASNLFR